MPSVEIVVLISFVVSGGALLAISKRNFQCVQWAGGVRLDLSEICILQIIWYHVRTREPSK
jgi:hypothetical protein